MKSARTYLMELRELSARKRGGWKLVTSSNPDESYEAQKIKKSLSVLNAESLLERLDLAESNQMDERSNFNKIINLLSASLHEDIRDCIDPSLYETLDSTVLGILSTGLVDAFCLNKDEFGCELDGAVICINEGLYYSLHLIAKSLVIESLTGDLAHLKGDGSESFMTSIKLYIEPKSSYIEQMFHRIGNADIEGEINAYQSSVAMLIMQFIALHEFGHIAHSDLGVMGLYKKHMASNVSTLEANNDVVSKYHEAEYKADEFALLGLCRRSEKEESKWANFYSIYLFFLWLDSLEKHLGKALCPYHPSPINRANNLKKIMINVVKNEDKYAHHLEWLDEKVAKWSGLK